MSMDTGRFKSVRSVRFLLILVLIIAFLATTAFEVISDASVHGLSTRISSVNRYCETTQRSLVKNVTFSIAVSVWSSSSLRTSISNVMFSLARDGTNLGTTSAPNRSWDPGGYSSFNLTFQDRTASPQALPAASTLLLSVAAQASAGIASASVTASDKTSQVFGNTSC